MALKALDIYKLLPKKNCKECGDPTCLTFAMNRLTYILPTRALIGLRNILLTDTKGTVIMNSLPHA